MQQSQCTTLLPTSYRIFKQHANKITTKCTTLLPTSYRIFKQHANKITSKCF